VKKILGSILLAPSLLLAEASILYSDRDTTIRAFYSDDIKLVSEALAEGMEKNLTKAIIALADAPEEYPTKYRKDFGDFVEKMQLSKKDLFNEVSVTLEVEIETTTPIGGTTTQWAIGRPECKGLKVISRKRFEELEAKTYKLEGDYSSYCIIQSIPFVWNEELDLFG